MYWLGAFPASRMLLIGSATVPVLVTVITCVALVVFLVTFPNASEPGANVKVGTITVPLSVTDCAATGAAKPMVIVAFFVPALVGLNVTLMVQLALADRTAGNAPQVLVWANCVVSPLMLLMVNGAVPVLATVTI